MQAGEAENLKRIVQSIAFATICVVPSSVLADEGLVNTDKGRITEVGAWNLNVRGTFHRNEEDRTYMSFGLNFGLMEGWDVGARVTTAPVGFAKTTLPIRTGGSDIELYVRHSPKELQGVTLGAGIAFPNTPAQDKPFLTYSGAYEFPVEGSQIRFFLGARGVARSDSSIFGISGGFAAPFGEGFELVGDITAIVSGVNTLDVNNGDKIRRAVYGLGLRYTPKTVDQNFQGSFFFGFTNGLGLTTGTSLSSSLSNRPALTLGVSIRGKS